MERMKSSAMRDKIAAPEVKPNADLKQEIEDWNRELEEMGVEPPEPAPEGTLVAFSKKTKKK